MGIRADKLGEELANAMRLAVNSQDLEVNLKMAAASTTQATQSKLEALLPDEQQLSKLILEFVEETLLKKGGSLFDEFSNRVSGGATYFPFYDTPDDGSVPYGTTDEKELEYEQETRGRGFGNELVEDYTFNPEPKEDTRRWRTQHINMRDGWRDLWKAIASKPVVKMQGNKGFVGIGPYDRVMALELSDYMPLEGRPADRSLNSLFLAVEFGTGLEENVGAGNVRTQGDAKNEDGSWWLGNDSIGVRFTGQKAFHFLTDARRAPLQKHEDFLRKQLPVFLNRVLGGAPDKRRQGTQGGTRRRVV